MKPILIAEIAKEHLGNMDKAKELIIAAKKSGFKYAKFQAYALDDINPEHPNYRRYCECWLNLDQLRELKKFSDEIKIGFYCSCFSKKMLKELSTFTDIIKVPSTFFRNEDFVKECMRHFKEVHLSTGMHTKEVIRELFGKYLYKYNLFNRELIFYHCTSEYPVKDTNIKLERLHDEVIKYEGYSDHTNGTKAMWLAWLMGAKYIEKHFAIRDYADVWTVIPKEMKRFNKLISYLEKVIKDDGKTTGEEKENYAYYSKEFNDLCNFRK